MEGFERLFSESVTPAAFQDDLMMSSFTVVVLAVVLLATVAGCDAAQPKASVVVYISEDQVFAEPILMTFGWKGGVR